MTRNKNRPQKFRPYKPHDKTSPTGLVRPKEYSSQQILTYFEELLKAGKRDIAVNEMTDLLSVGGHEFVRFPFPPTIVVTRADAKAFASGCVQRNPETFNGKR